MALSHSTSPSNQTHPKVQSCKGLLGVGEIRNKEFKGLKTFLPKYKQQMGIGEDNSKVTWSRLHVSQHQHLIWRARSGQNPHEESRL